MASSSGNSPFGLLAELTYRCPLACAYCSNPLNMADYSDELDTDEWRRVLAEARDLGVLQCHLSGGEHPVESLWSTARQQGRTAHGSSRSLGGVTRS